ncbi:MAG: hypothetical protein EA401_01515 [Planctomycetota bacterium]|nr:MAG: hypothetical protein EA401_01515 [Planctomycetota bacterium]
MSRPESSSISSVAFSGEAQSSLSMSERIIDTIGLESYIPHRGINLLPDTVYLAEDLQSSRSTTTILDPDPRGRDLLYRIGSDGERYWNEAFLIELTALTGIPMISEALAQEGKVAVFSAISKLDLPAPAPLHGTITGYAQMTRQRSGFAQFTGSLECNGVPILQAQFMSGSAAIDDIAKQGAASQPSPPAATSLPSWPWKPSPLRFIDGVIASDDQQWQGSYCYPSDHPFVPGHFPGGPLMMGVTQCSAIADGLTAWVMDRQLADGRYTCDGLVARPDGSEVASARKLAIAVSGGTSRLEQLDRIVFKDVVRPNDTLLISVNPVL